MAHSQAAPLKTSRTAVNAEHLASGVAGCVAEQRSQYRSHAT